MKLCSKCNEEKSIDDFSVRKESPDGRRGVCKACRNEGSSAYRLDNLDKRREYERRYKKARRESDPDFAESSRVHYKKWREANRDYDLERQARYRSENLSRYALHAANRRALRKNAEGSFTLDEWLAVCDSFGNLCLACRQEKPLTIDHVVPLSKGGSNFISNIQPLCGPCNSSKKDKEIDYRLGFRP